MIDLVAEMPLRKKQHGVFALQGACTEWPYIISQLNYFTTTMNPGQGWVFVAQQLTLPPLETSDVVCSGFRVVESRQTYHGDRVSSLAAIYWPNTQEPEPARGEAAPFTGLP